MFSPNKKHPDLQRNGIPPKEQKPMGRETKRRLWATVGMTLFLLVIWYGCLAVGEAQHNDTLVFGVMIAYFLVFAALIITYLIYNRGFVNKDVTEDMLPSDWSEEKKQAFLEDNRRRAERSRWMMIVIIPFIIVFMCEALYLFVWDAYLANYFKG
jgi:predicted nucleic acid-binding Zn ribbon protein